MSKLKSNPVNFRRKEQTAIITIDNPPVNATSLSVRQGLMLALERAVSNKCKNGIVICDGKTFVAGGDISEFGKPPQEPHLPDVYNAFEDSEIIWLAAMHGSVLGGGFELALACDYRIAAPGTKFGLPEVNLGLIPGAGGTQRLPRLVELEMAIEMACMGRIMSADKLTEAGALDKTVSGNLIEEAVQFLHSTELEKKPVSRLIINQPASNILDSKKIALKKFAKGADAPLQNLKAIKWALKLPFSEGLKRERKLHLELRDSEQSRALRHIFFAERAVSKPSIIKGLNSNAINTVAIVGGGLMGAGIAASCLSAGFDVRMIEQDDASANAGYDRVKAILTGGLDRNKINQSQFDRQMAKFNAGASYDLANDADLAIEAVFEDLKTKQSVFEKLASFMGENAIIATNTSYLDPQQIGLNIQNPARLIGMHFFSPAHLMKLVEIIRTPSTGAQTIADAFAFTKRLRKTAILCGICDGFVGNRMLAAYRRQADYFLADGASPGQIDEALRDFGLPMGPYELQDMTGLQIAWANRKRQASTRNPKERYVTIGDQLCEIERFGQRSGKGWYRYEPNNRKPVIDEAVTEIIEQYSRNANITRKKFEDDYIANSLMAVLANEGARIVEEGIVERDLDVDVVKIFGYGFPRWRGGPMHYASTLGENVIRKKLVEIKRQSPDSWVLADRYS